MAFASDLPDWVIKTPSSDTEYKYYVGRSEPLSTEAAAFTAADKSAREQAIKDNFGSDFQVNTVSSDSMQSSISNTRTQERSSNVNLSGFEMVSDKLISNQEGDSAKYVRYILFKYSKKSILKEKERLAGLVGSAQPEFNISGDQSKCRTLSKTNLEITATEFKSKVIINGEVIGFTPLKIFCLEVNDAHIKLQIDHPYYETYEEDVAVVIGGQTKVHAILKEAFVNLSINSEPSGAKVIVDGEDTGATPISNIKVQAGKPARIELSHPETEKLLQEVVFDKSAESEVIKSFKLPYKSSYFTLSSNPIEAQVFVDGASIGNTPVKKTICEPGVHKLEIQKDGFKLHTQELNCVGGQTTNLKSVQLIKYAGPENKVDVQASVMSSPFEDIDLVYSGLELGYSGTIYKQLFYSLSLGFMVAEKTYDNATLESEAYFLAAGLPYYFYTNIEKSKWIELKPQVAYSSFSFTSKYSNGSESSIDGKKQFAYGLGLGYKFHSQLITRVAYFQNGDSDTLKGKPSIRLSLGGSWDF